MPVCSDPAIDVKVNAVEWEAGHMRIGELSERTGTPRRLLRYYEEQGLIAPDRLPNGYRDYDERLVDRVRQIRGLLDSGLPTRLIRLVLPCLDRPCTIHFPDPTPEMLATLEHELARMDDRISCLTRNRDAVADYLATVRAGAPAPVPAVPPPGDGTDPAAPVSTVSGARER
jgi:DNA-binding transcriptional MerR regulator